MYSEETLLDEQFSLNTEECENLKINFNSLEQSQIFNISDISHMTRCSSSSTPSLDHLLDLMIQKLLKN